MSWERSPLDEAKKHKMIEKLEMSKMPVVDPLVYKVKLHVLIFKLRNPTLITENVFDMN